MVNETSTSNPHILEWTSDGRAFEIKDVSLMPSIIERYFRHNKYSSLQRNLHLYGFTKHENLFRHVNFTRGSTRKGLIMMVTKDDGYQGETRGKNSRPHHNASKSQPASRTKKRAKHAKPGQHQKQQGGGGGGGGSVPRHALFSSKPKASPTKRGQGKQGGHQGEVGATHPSLLFNQPKTVVETVMPSQPTPKEDIQAQSKDDGGVPATKATQSQSKDDNDDGQHQQPDTTPTQPNPTQPTPNDIILSLKNPDYQRTLFVQFKSLGRKNNNGKADDSDLIRNAAASVLSTFHQCKSSGTTMENGGDGSGGGGGRFLKKVKGDISGNVWYEAVDDSWAVQKIHNDLRRRMEYAKYWLNENESPSGDDGTSQQPPPVHDDQNKSQNEASIAAATVPNTVDQNNTDAVACDLQEDFYEYEDPMPTASDLTISLKACKYRKIMFALFKKLGEKKSGQIEDNEMLKMVGRQTIDVLKKEMNVGDNSGSKGRFFRQTRGWSRGNQLQRNGAAEGEAPYELLDDASVLT
ncbi:hypothetical protein ACHAXR_002145, partial [Thalassiosira sp. AJA248-18]